MKKMKYIFAFTVLFVTAACTEEDYKLYDIQQKDNIFFDYKNAKEVNDSVISYTFGYDIAQTHTLEIPVTLMGMPSNRVRKIGVKAVPDSTDMVENTHYIIERAELRANAINDTVKITLLRDKDSEIRERMFKLYLLIEENDDLQPTGQKTFFIEYSDIRPTLRPSWWTVWSPMPEYSFENAQLFFKYFYDLAPQANKEIFDEMVATYGDYFVNASNVQGPLSMYDAFLAKYILIPMYEDYNEDNGKVGTMVWQSKPSVN